jgi:hypothetical protein
MDLNMTYLLDAVGLGTGARDFMVQVIAGIVAGAILIIYTALVTEPRRDAKLTKIEEERTAKQNKIEDERIEKQNKREDEIRQKATKLKEIYNQLAFYRRVNGEIKHFQNTLSPTVFLIDTKGLELAILDIQTETGCEFDDGAKNSTKDFYNKFLGQPNKNTLENVFLNAIKMKIIELETKRKLYE